MWILYLLALIIKGLLGFFGIAQIFRLCMEPGFAQMHLEGKRKNKNILLNNFIMLIVCWGSFYIMGLLGINILGN